MHTTPAHSLSDRKPKLTPESGREIWRIANSFAHSQACRCTLTDSMLLSPPVVALIVRLLSANLSSGFSANLELEMFPPAIPSLVLHSYRQCEAVCACVLVCQRVTFDITPQPSAPHSEHCILLLCVCKPEVGAWGISPRAI